MKLLISSESQLFIVDATIGKTMPLESKAISFTDLTPLSKKFYGIDIDGKLWEITTSSNTLDTLSSHMTFSTDNFGGFPRWITFYDGILLFGGNGIDIMSVYYVKINDSRDGETIRSTRTDTQRGYNNMFRSVISKKSIRKQLNSDSQLQILSSTITTNGTYYLAKIIYGPELYFLISSEDRSIKYKLLKNLPSQPICIKTYDNDILGFFQSDNGFLYGKLTMSKGLVTKSPHFVYFNGPVDALTIMD